MSWKRVCLAVGALIFAASTVIEVSATTALSIVTSALSSGQQGAAYSSTISAQGGTAPYRWGVASGTLPAGIALNATTGVLAGEPSQSGTFTFTVGVTDASAKPSSIKKSLTLSVVATPLSIVTTALVTGQQGAAYSSAISAQGGTAPYRWGVASGTLPAGIALNATTGVLAGKPSQSGTFAFTISAGDSATIQQVANRAFSLLVAPRVSITVYPAAVTLLPGNVQRFVASVTGTSNNTVRWAVGGIPGGNADAGTISTDGVYTAPANPISNIVTITATTAATPTQSASAIVTYIYPVDVEAAHADWLAGIEDVARTYGCTAVIQQYASESIADVVTRFASIASPGSCLILSPISTDATNLRYSFAWGGNIGGNDILYISDVGVIRIWSGTTAISGGG